MTARPLLIPGVLALTFWCGACDDGKHTASPAPGPARSAPIAATASAGSTAEVASTATAAAEPDALSAADFAKLFRTLSEPDEYFFSDNFVSNETSYLQVAASLAERTVRGRAYIGVGPEQNFTYIALTEPKLAFIVDIRRQNALLHLLYKAVFHEARDRAHFLALLLGRPDPGKLGGDAGIDEVIRAATRKKPDAEHFESVHARLVKHITGELGVKLSDADVKKLRSSHRAFFDDQLKLHFVLKENNGRTYPSLRSLLEARSPGDEQGGFLATEAAFRTVQRLQNANRVIPVVGDFGGERAFAGVAEELERRKLVVGALYVSNVEQYLFEPGKWARWVKNVAALPSDERSLFVRCYLDQGKRHPKQLEGHRTATVLQSISAFEKRNADRPYTSWYAVATDGVL